MILIPDGADRALIQMIRSSAGVLQAAAALQETGDGKLALPAVKSIIAGLDGIADNLAELQQQAR